MSQDDEPGRGETLRERIHLFEQALQDVVIGVAFADLSGRYRTVNPAFCRLLGFTHDELLTLNLEGTLAGAVTLEDPPGRGQPGSGRLRWVRRPDGSQVHLSVMTSLLSDASGDPALVFVQLQEVPARQRPPAPPEGPHDRQAAVAQLVQETLGGLPRDALFRQALTAVQRGLAVELAEVLELAPDGKALRLRAEIGSKAGTASVPELPAGPGTLGGAVLASSFPVLVDDVRRETRFAPAPSLAERGWVSTLATAITVEGRPSGILSAHATRPRRFRDDDAHFLQVVGNVVAAGIERDLREERLRHQVTHDELTGLANRALLRDRLELALLRLPRAGSPVAVLFIDLDHFKQVNDRFGHAAGDRLLGEVGVRLRGAVRQEDTAARLGGDEFVVLCEAVSGRKEAEAIAGRVCSALAAPWPIDGEEVSAKASIGLVVTAVADRSADELIDDADAAMYAAKAGGGGRWADFDPSMRHEDAETPSR